MDSGELKKLRQFYHSLLGQQKILNGIPINVGGKRISITSESLFSLENTLDQFNKEFPSIMPVFNKNYYYSHTVEGSTTYYLTGIQLYLADAIGRIQSIIDQPEESATIEKCQFKFISDSELRMIIERDYIEIQKADMSKCWKSVIILCGGAIEAILIDLLNSNETEAKASKSAPKKPEIKCDITQWDLSHLIKVALELKLIPMGVEKLSDPIREYRNLVHPGYEVRKKLHFGAEEAKIAFQVLKILHRDLSKN